MAEVKVPSGHVAVVLPVDTARKMIGAWYLVKKQMSDQVRIAMASAVDRYETEAELEAFFEELDAWPNGETNE